jgi:ParB family chromosome partitioning protein
MTKKRRMFDIDLPADAPAPDASGTAGLRRGPMATAIGETGASLRERAAAEAEIRAENDALAQEFVRLKKLGLVTDMIPLDAVRTTRLIRDRARHRDLDLGDLKAEVRRLLGDAA